MAPATKDGNDTMNGTIKRLVADRGFGFIAQSDGGKDLFFHRSQSEAFEDLQNGDNVTYDSIEQSDKGPRAVGVKLASAVTA